MPITMIVTVLVVSLLGLCVGAVAAHGAEAVMGRRRLGRPACPYCAQAYTPLQWSATLALITGQGRCCHCGKFFRVPRLLCEVFVALCWALLVGRYGLSWRVLLGMVGLLPLAMIMVTDLETKRVPNLIMLPSIAVMLLIGIFAGPALPLLREWDWLTVIYGALAGFGVLRVLVWLGVAVFGEGALGEGDITLATYVGAFLGFPMVIEALLLAFVLGGLGAVIVLVTRRGTMRTAIAYGPYIILGCAITLIFGSDIVQWLY